MKRMMCSMLMVILLASLIGCVTKHGHRPWACMGGSCAQAPENCKSCNDSCDEDQGRGCRECGGRGCGLCRHHGQADGDQQQAQAGPATGTVTYPYYTTRGPRDFLAKHPESIGP